MSTINYEPQADLLDFHNSTAPIRLVCGSPGGGKTVGALMEVLFLAMRQKPDNEGLRKHRVLIVRSTYARLKTTVLKTLVEWYPKECGSIKQTAPMEGLYIIPMPDGTRVHLEVIGLALEDEKSLQSMRSLEVSSIYLNEINEQDRAVLDIAIERVGRYPSAKNGAPCTEPAIIGDFNTVSTEHWLYDVCVKNPLAGLEFFMQQPAVLCNNFDEWFASSSTDKTGGEFELNPDAPNIANLPSDYYSKMLDTYDKRKIAALLCLKWVSSAPGKLVHPEFSRRDHVGVVRTQPHQNETVMIGIDTSGLHPAAVIGQPQSGSLVVMDVVFGDGVAFEQFITEMLLPVLAERYQGCELLAITDPSNPRDARTGVTPNQLLMQYNIRAQSASTNKFDLRRQAVSSLLNRRNGLVIDPACSLLITALEEGYVFRKLPGSASTGGAMYASDPLKNIYSHVMDALQYLCLPLARTGEEVFGQRHLPQLRKRRVV